MRRRTSASVGYNRPLRLCAVNCARVQSRRNPTFAVSLPLAFASAAARRATRWRARDRRRAASSVELHAERALYWPRERTLFVADVHLGKAAAFRAGGVPLPRGATAADLARLTRLHRAHRRDAPGRAGRLPARASRPRRARSTPRSSRGAHGTRRSTSSLVRGNHDAHAGDPPADWDVECVAEPHPLPPFLACHVPVAPRSGYALCGHVHPGVRLARPRRASRRGCPASCSARAARSCRRSAASRGSRRAAARRASASSPSPARALVCHCRTRRRRLRRRETAPAPALSQICNAARCCRCAGPRRCGQSGG